jgi:hypothetical protein
MGSGKPKPGSGRISCRISSRSRKVLVINETGMKKGENMVMARMGRTAKVIKEAKGFRGEKTEKGCGSDNNL